MSTYPAHYHRQPLFYVITLISSIIAAYFFTGGRLFVSVSVFFAATLWSMSIWLTQAFGNGWIISKLDEHISWIETPWRRFFVGFTVLIGYSLFAFQFAHLSFGYFIFEWWTGYKAMSADFWMEFYYSGRIAVIIAVGIATVLTAVGFLKGWREQTLRAAKLEKLVAQQQYESLKRNIDPHFLFNSLNVLSELVHTDPKKADAFSRQLGEVYRYVLDSSTNELVLIEEELHFVRAYAELLQTRFGGAFRFKVNIRDTDALTRGYVVPMAFQLLLENAVKHNVVSSEFPLDVELNISNDQITCSNQKQLRSTPGDSKKLGLHYLAEQYKALGQGNIEVNDREKFTVKLPIIQVLN